MWTFLDAHPWWGLIYLLVICFTILVSVAGIFSSASRRRQAAYDEFRARRKGEDDVVH